MAEQQCIEAEQLAEMFGTLERLPIALVTSAGSLDVYKVLELVHDESIASLFKFVGEELEITHKQFFRGCAAIAPQQDRRIIGFVRHDDGLLWTFSKLGLRFEADAPGVSHKGRNQGDLILAPAFQPPPPPILPPIFRTQIMISGRRI